MADSQEHVLRERKGRFQGLTILLNLRLLHKHIFALFFSRSNPSSHNALLLLHPNAHFFATKFGNNNNVLLQVSLIRIRRRTSHT